MKTIKGDLLEYAKNSKFDYIIHGCNCLHIMGAGIAKQIRSQFPDAYIADKLTKKGDKNKLGTYSICNTEKFSIINGYIQFGIGKGSIDYNALQQLFANIKKDFGNKNKIFGIPKIGAGLAGGDWKIIKEIIEKEMYDEEVILVIF